MKKDKATLILSDGSKFEGTAFGYKRSTAAEVVFTTGMVGYDLSLTDPSYAGQILTFTYPLIGNWGIPKKEHLESEKIHAKGVVISDLSINPNHHAQVQTLNTWLIKEKIPAIVGIDTRALTQKLREKGVMLGKIIIDSNNVPFFDPNLTNLVAQVSIKELKVWQPVIDNQQPAIKIGLLNCGAKRNIIRCLTARGVTVYELPWDYDPFKNKLPIDGLVISNGPGDPKMATKSIAIIKKALERKMPTFGICLGNQLLALAAGGDTYKLKFGHRAQNQPTIEVGNLPAGRQANKCYITSQNHGFTVNEKKMPTGFKRWFYNANDNTNEGIKHDKLPFYSVQFHPEAAPGPTDTEFLFDYFLNIVKKNRSSYFLKEFK